MKKRGLYRAFFETLRNKNTTSICYSLTGVDALRISLTTLS